jgi:TPR repeat protein
MPDPSRNAVTQPIPVGQPGPGPLRRGRLRNWIVGGLAVLILAAVALSYLRDRPGAAPGTEAPGMFRPQKPVPPTARPYYDKAMAGDASAMRMLGAMYYYGLNVPQDTKEGIHWYRKAAAAGSVAAQKDLQQLGLAPE